MTKMFKLRRRLVHSSCWFSTRNAETRSMIPASPQITQESLSFDAVRAYQKHLLACPITVDQRDRSRSLRSRASSAPIKSP